MPVSNPKSRASIESEPVSNPINHAFRESAPVLSPPASQYPNEELVDPLPHSNGMPATSPARDDGTDPTYGASSSAVVIPSPLPRSGSEYLTDVILSRCSTGIRISAFTSDIRALKHSLDLHGLLSLNDDLVSCRIKLLYHIFTGGCVRNESDHHRHAACTQMSTGFPSAHSMVSFALDVLMRTDADTIVDTAHLLAVAHCLGMPKSNNAHNLRHRTFTYLRQH